MKSVFLTTAFILATSFLMAQDKIDSLVSIGIKYHDKGQYAEAIEVYKKALAIDPASPLANNEIALTYMYDKQYENAIRHCDMTIDLNNKYSIGAYINKGSCLDNLGKPEEAVKLFEKGIKNFGHDYLLQYNLGLTLVKMQQYEKAQDAFVYGINSKPDHASSHILLGFTMSELDQKVKSLLSLHYFLLLEPGSQRSQQAYDLLRKQFGGNVKENDDKSVDITLSLGSPDSEFGAADMMISLLAASKTLKENKKKTDDELFNENTTSFFKVLGELKTKKNKGLWWEFYIPLFYELARSENMEAYCYFITQSSNDKAAVWLANNSVKVDALKKWLTEKQVNIK